MAGLWEWLGNVWNVHQGLILVLFFVTACWSYSNHLRRRVFMVVVFWSIILVGLIVFLALAFKPNDVGKFSAEELGTTLLGYAAALYAMLCDLFRFGLARRLTDKRGRNWIKELDYPYLLLGTIGLFVSMTKLSVVAGETSRYEVLGPLLVATAIVLRLIKTKAEIDEWARL
jgi:hypothetical protein